MNGISKWIKVTRKRLSRYFPSSKTPPQNSVKAKKLVGGWTKPPLIKVSLYYINFVLQTAILSFAVWMLSFGEVRIFNCMYIRLFSLFFYFICVAGQEEVRKYRINVHMKHRLFLVWIVIKDTLKYLKL